MTGYTVHTGASKKFVSGWDRIFAADDSADQTQSRAETKSAAGRKRSEKSTDGERKSAKSGRKKSS